MDLLAPFVPGLVHTLSTGFLLRSAQVSCPSQVCQPSLQCPAITAGTSPNVGACSCTVQSVTFLSIGVFIGVIGTLVVRAVRGLVKGPSAAQIALSKYR